MKVLSPFSGGFHQRRQVQGAALILVLACVAILSTLVIAYLLHSQIEAAVATSSAGQTRADLFARGAVDAVIGELRQEITAGSTVYAPTGSDLRDPNCLFIPTANANAVPYRMDPNAPPNVIKWSAYGKPFYPDAGYDTGDWPAPKWAADSLTTTASASGHSISPTTWNMPLLMAKADTTGTNLAPVSTFTAPDWIYLDRTATVPVTTFNAKMSQNTLNGTSNPNYVVGRYAYVIYNEGGLLDANAAGYPSTLPATTFRHKISEACADLTQIGLANSDIDALVTWRNPINGTSANYSNYVYNPSTNAFVTPATGERVFTSRQQLISFLTQNIGNSDNAVIARVQNALPSLTHFSRELNSPSLYPLLDASAMGGSGSFPYASNKTSPTATNTFIPDARSTGTFTNSSKLAVQMNQPLAFSRFPLSRLAWLGANGIVGTASITDVQKSFGLVWDSNFAAWKYVGPTGGGVQSAIETLNQVAQEATPREPNFFELLKAGILSGSLGMYAGPDALGPLGLNVIDSRYTTNSVDQHVMQIGLAIMDQASTSPLPSRIEFGSNQSASALYGTKNLPYLYKLAFSPYRPNQGSNFEAWLEPIFWDPYITTATSTTPLSLQLGLASGGQANVWAWYLHDGVNYYYYPTSPALDATSSITIKETTANAGTLSQTTRTPTFLRTLITPDGYSVTGQNTYTEGTTTYSGFWLGEAPFPGTQTTTSGAPPDFQNCAPNFTPTSPSSEVQFILKANYGTAGYQEVERMNFSNSASGAWATDYNQFTVLGRRYDYFTFLDPRTGRIGFNMTQFPGYQSYYPFNNYPLNTNPNESASAIWTSFWSSTQNFSDAIQLLPATASSLAQTYGSPGATTGGSAYRWADNSSTTGSTDSPAYLDADGVHRQGDAWYSSVTANTLPMRGDTTNYRPILLERNLYSVGDLGYAYRDMPWRSLDFSTAKSADAGLLDLFCVNDGFAGSTTSPVVGGRIDLNTSQPKVLAAMLSGAYRSELDTTYATDIDSDDANSIGTSIVNVTTATPLLNKSEIATRLAPTPVDADTVSGANDSNIKERREGVVRALAEAGQVRTWNLMIDVVAQVGHLAPTATNLDNFVVDSERRYWAHVALDRYTGQVIDMQIEPVNH